VLDAALEVLARDPDAPMSAVADCAGLTRTTVYRHFPSREDLARALFDQVVAEAVGAVEAILSGDPAPPPEAFLRRIAATFVALGDRYRFLDRHQDLVAQWRRELPDDEPLQRWAARAAAAGDLRPGVTPAWLVGAVSALAAASFDEVQAGRATVDDAAQLLGDTLVAAFLKS
jgi:AcrR family transcriptional regulator